MEIIYSASCIKEARAKYDSYGSDWEKAYFDEKSGGFNVYHKDHEFSDTGGGGKAEKTIGIILANRGKKVEFLPEGKGKMPDLYFDSQTWEVKYINNANIKTIRGYIEHARRKKAENVIFYWDIYDKSEDLINTVARESGRLKKLGRINEMPDIYYIDKTGLKLKLLWKK